VAVTADALATSGELALGGVTAMEAGFRHRISITMLFGLGRADLRLAKPMSLTTDPVNWGALVK
jgi:hypothetical protein